MGSMFAGADGCRSGWAVTWLDEQDWFQPVAIYSTLADLVAAMGGATTLLVDIPMGLKEEGDERLCDLETRRLLGPRSSTLFRVPVRAAVHASEYRTANLLNRAATGKGLSAQAFGICRKIAEADQLLRANPGLQGWVYESHPEACFAALNGWQPLPEKKKSTEGLARRLEILAVHTANAVETFVQAEERYLRKALALDDILDAMVMALAARLAALAGMPTIPSEPEQDEYGLTMQIVVPFHRPD